MKTLMSFVDKNLKKSYVSKSRIVPIRLQFLIFLINSLGSKLIVRGRYCVTVQTFYLMTKLEQNHRSKFRCAFCFRIVKTCYGPVAGEQYGGENFECHSRLGKLLGVTALENVCEEFIMIRNTHTVQRRQPLLSNQPCLHNFEFSTKIKLCAFIIFE